MGRGALSKESDKRRRSQHGSGKIRQHQYDKKVWPVEASDLSFRAGKDEEPLAGKDEQPFERIISREEFEQFRAPEAQTHLSV